MKMQLGQAFRMELAVAHLVRMPNRSADRLTIGTPGGAIIQLFGKCFPVCLGHAHSSVRATRILHAITIT
jgi:hypothetical protein